MTGSWTRGACAALLIALGATGAAAQAVSQQAREALAGDDPQQLSAAFAEYEQHVAELGVDDVRALARAMRDVRVHREAAPELRRALEAIAEGHPNPMLGRQAAARAAELEDHVRLVRLKRAVEAAQAKGAAGVEQWVALARESVELNLRRGLSNAEVIDAVVLDLGQVANSRFQLREHLGTYQRTLHRLPGRDPLLDPFLEQVEARPDVGHVGMHDLERSDFRPELHDGTTTQVFHSNFFVVLGYAVGEKDKRLPHMVNLFHETIDRHGGTSVEDWRASAVGIETGRRIRALREAGGDPRQIPAIIGASFALDPERYADVWGPQGPDYTQLVDEVAEDARQRARSPRGSSIPGRAASMTQAGLIRGLNGLYRDRTTGR